MRGSGAMELRWLLKSRRQGVVAELEMPRKPIQCQQSSDSRTRKAQACLLTPEEPIE